MPQKNETSAADLEAEIAEVAATMAPPATPLGPVLAKADADEREAAAPTHRPTQDDANRVAVAEHIMAQEVETSLVSGFMEAWRRAGCPPIGRGDLSALHAVQKVAGHFAQRGREHNDITKARAA
jgi:hypothetical protein